MARSDTLRSDILRLEATAAGLRRDPARHGDASAKARAAAGKKRQDAERTRSDSTRRGALRSAGEQDKKLVAAEKRIGEITTKLAANSKAQTDKRRSLAAAERTERQVADWEEQRRRREEKTHAREVARLSRVLSYGRRATSAVHRGRLDCQVHWANHALSGARPVGRQVGHFLRVSVPGYGGLMAGM